MAGWVSSLETAWSTTRKCGSFCARNCSSTATFLRSVLYRPTLFVAMFKPLRYRCTVFVSTPFTGYAGNDVDDSFHVHVFCVLFIWVCSRLACSVVWFRFSVTQVEQNCCIWMFLFVYADCKAYALAVCRCCYYRISLVTLCLPTPDGIYTLR